MLSRTSFWVFILILSTLFACKQSGKKPTTNIGEITMLDTLPVKYAKGFSVAYYKDYKLVTVKDWRNQKILAQYILSTTKGALSATNSTAIFILTPVKKIVCLSTNHIGELDRLDLLDSIAAVSNVNLIYSQAIQQKIRNKTITDIGNFDLNYEKIAMINPAFVFTSGDWDGGDKMKLKLDALHIKSVLNLDYLEQDPLARAEWLKFVAVFYNKEIFADSIFTAIEQNYLTLKIKMQSVKTKPTVFMNLPFKEIWYMPSGDNYSAKLMADAGADYLWKEAKATNGLNMNLDYESVYNKAANADYWISTGLYFSLDAIKNADKKNSFFKAYKTGHVFNEDLRNTASGGLDFWESGVVNPDIILADLISILHPDSLPNHKLYYYRKLNTK